MSNFKQQAATFFILTLVFALINIVMFSAGMRNWTLIFFNFFLLIYACYQLYRSYK